jgi:hypothetical protein
LFEPRRSGSAHRPSLKNARTTVVTGLLDFQPPRTLDGLDQIWRRDERLNASADAGASLWR